MNRFDFSVIIPTLHEEKAIEKTLSSIHAAKSKSRRNVEVIIVDGGSNDKTIDVAKRYTDKVLLTEKSGIGKARNFGAKYAKGETLVFIDADVRIPENFFSELYEQFTMNNLAGANCRVMPHAEVEPSRFERGFYTFWHSLRRFFYNIKPCGTGDNGIIVKKDVFQRVKGFDETFDTIEDLDFVFRASKYGRFAYLKNLTIYETIRRFRRLGLPRFSMIYLYNFFHYLFFRRSKVKQWKPVR